jgi:chemotaxis receptor (MCP) glutamine deamidase CheD
MADLVASNIPVLVTLGLGSCIGSSSSTETKVAGCAHMFPSMESKNRSEAGQVADTAVLKWRNCFSAHSRNLQAKIAEGSDVSVQKGIGLLRGLRETLSNEKC